MEKCSQIREIQKELHHISFHDVIRYQNGNEPCRAPEVSIKNVEDYCHICDKFSFPERKENPNLRLNNISHGSHSLDFLTAMGMPNLEEEIASWNDTPVLFLMENPSYDYKIYDYIDEDTNPYPKRPAKEWYWIHSEMKSYGEFVTDDRFLKHGEYGRMVASLICKFKLANAYLTNAVKCGMSDAIRIDDADRNNVVETEYCNLENYPSACKKKCVKQVLENEIKALCKFRNTLKVFAFGVRPYWLMKDYLENGCEIEELKYQLLQLPHPAYQLKDSYRRLVLKGMVQESLDQECGGSVRQNKKIISPDEVRKIFRDVYSRDGLRPLGDKKTSKQYSIKVDVGDSLFRNIRFAKEVAIYGRIDSEIKEWGIGFNILTGEEWAWDYDKKEYVDKEKIPGHNSFDKAVEILKNRQ